MSYLTGLMVRSLFVCLRCWRIVIRSMGDTSTIAVGQKMSIRAKMCTYGSLLLLFVYMFFFFFLLSFQYEIAVVLDFVDFVGRVE